MAKPGRNDPCFCGSGKKYKNCHWLQDQAATQSRLNTKRARQSLFSRLVEFAQRPRLEAEYKSAFDLFWDGRRKANERGALTPLESIRFYEWYVVDYRTGDNRQRLIDMFRASSAGYITPEERDYLGAWQSAKFTIFEVRELAKGSAVHIYDLLREEGHDVKDDNFTATMKPGEVYMARLVRHGEGTEFLLSVSQVPIEERDNLITFARDKYRLYAEAHFGAAMDEFLRESGYLFNHFLLDARGEAAQASGKVLQPTSAEVQKTAATLSVTR